jgi:Trypsin-co-occurring domain 1
MSGYCGEQLGGQHEEPAGERPEPGAAGEVLVQVLPVDGGREIGWGSNQVAVFRDRLADVRAAMVSGAQAVADGLEGLPPAAGWRLREISGSFGISLTTEGGVILMKAAAGTTFEITVTFERASP